MTNRERISEKYSGKVDFAYAKIKIEGKSSEIQIHKRGKNAEINFAMSVVTTPRL
jgi:hypothetical protein